MLVAGSAFMIKLRKCNVYIGKRLVAYRAINNLIVSALALKSGLYAILNNDLTGHTLMAKLRYNYLHSGGLFTTFGTIGNLKVVAIGFGGSIYTGQGFNIAGSMLMLELWVGRFVSATGSQNCEHKEND
jgi:hypothetical protein